MIYQSVSIKEVIGRVIRNTRVQDTAYIIDMNSWIPEAMEMMQTRQETIGVFEEKIIKFHKTCMPCGMLYIDAIEHMGHRLPYGECVKNIRRANTHDPRLHPRQPEAFTSIPFQYPAPGDQTHLYFSTLRKVEQLPLHDKHYYQVELGTILTDFSDGHITVYGRATPTDPNGLPLIPDNSNYKEALYWWVRGRMIGAGFDDAVIKLEKCEQMWDLYAPRAIAEIDYPSPDQMEERVNTFNRLIPQYNYFETFNRSQKEQFYDPLGPTDSYYI